MHYKVVILVDDLTLGDLAKWLAFIVGLISSVVYLKKGTIKGIASVIDERLEPIKKEVENLKEETSKNNLSSIKTDLINLMELADKEKISPEQKMRSYELYDYYCKHGGNSYVHDKWERLKNEGKI
jgi:hypothetical protein